MPATVHVVCPHCDTVNRVPRQRLHEASKCGSCHLPLFEQRPVELTDAIRFRKHANKSDLPVLVDFWAAWCGPCRATAPIFEKAAAEFEPDVQFVKVDSDAVPELLRRFHDQNLPTLLLVHRGREITRKSGLLSLPALLAWVSAKCQQCWQSIALPGPCRQVRHQSAAWKHSSEKFSHSFRSAP